MMKTKKKKKFDQRRKKKRIIRYRNNGNIFYLFERHVSSLIAWKHRFASLFLAGIEIDFYLQYEAA